MVRVSAETGSAEGGAPARFRALVAEVEAPLRRALVAAYGPDLGREAAADALGWAWEHFARVEAMENPAGYLYRVGQSSARRAFRRAGRERSWDGALVASNGGDDRPPVEPALLPALARLTPNQRSAVLLVHGYRYTLAEAAAIHGCHVSTLRNHLARGMASLRLTLGVTDA